MIDMSTAAGAYGFQHGVRTTAVEAQTTVGADPSLGKASGSLSLGTQNPLFWLLLILLLFTGWIFGAFDFAFGAKKIGSVGFKAKAGR